MENNVLYGCTHSLFVRMRTGHNISIQAGIQHNRRSVVFSGPIHKANLRFWFDTTLERFESSTWTHRTRYSSLSNFILCTTCYVAPLSTTILFVPVEF